MNRLGAVHLLGVSKLLDTEQRAAILARGRGENAKCLTTHRVFDPAAGGGQMIVEALRQLTGQGVAAGLTVLVLHGDATSGERQFPFHR